MPYIRELKEMRNDNLTTEAQKTIRSATTLIKDILSAVNDSTDESGLNVYKISHTVKLNHGLTIKKLHALVEAGLLNRNKQGDDILYKINEKGSVFLAELQRLERILENFHLRF